MGGNSAPAFDAVGDSDDLSESLGVSDDGETETDLTYQEAVEQGRKLVQTAERDEQNRIKDDSTRWALGDLMVSMWPRVERTKEEASLIQEKLYRFAIAIDYKPAMIKDWYYVAQQWPPGTRVADKSFAQHSKLRSRSDKGWALLGIHQGADSDAESLKHLNQAQIRKVEKVLQSIEALDDETSAVLDAVVGRLTPKSQRPAKKIIQALRAKEKQARIEAEKWRKRKSPLVAVYEHQAFLLSAAARTQALVEFSEEYTTQAERDYIRKVIEGTVYVNQLALDELLDILNEPVSSEREAVIVDAQDAVVKKQLETG